MKNFFEKLSANPAMKIIVCVLIAVPIWALFTFVDFDGEGKTVDVKPIETSSTTSDETSSEINDITEQDDIANQTETLFGPLFADMKTEEQTTDTGEETFMANENFAFYNITVNKDKTLLTMDEDLPKSYDTKFTQKLKEKTDIFKDKDVALSHGETSRESSIIKDKGTIEEYAYETIIRETPNTYKIAFGVQFNNTEKAKEVFDLQMAFLTKPEDTAINQPD